MLLSGKEIAEEITNQIKVEIEKNNLTPKLGIILVGNYKASQIYVQKKCETAKRIGIQTEIFNFPETVKEDELLGFIKELNSKEKLNGFIVQLPLPKHIDANKIIEAIDPKKDVDGFHSSNMGKLFLNSNDGAFVPATPAGIMKMIEHYKIPVSGANTVVIGRSNIVGKPIAIMLLHKDATVTVCHSKTKNLANYTKQADILVVAVGQPFLIKPEMVKQGAYVIDVGITQVGEKIAGDVDLKVQKKANVSPVPGGVGPLTVAMLLQNTLKAAKIDKFG